MILSAQILNIITICVQKILLNPTVNNPYFLLHQTFLICTHQLWKNLLFQQENTGHRTLIQLWGSNILQQHSKMPFAISSWHMLFCFVGQGVWAKPPVPEYWLKPLTAKTCNPMEKHAIPATVAYRSTKVFRSTYMNWMRPATTRWTTSGR